LIFGQLKMTELRQQQKSEILAKIRKLDETLVSLTRDIHSLLGFRKASVPPEIQGLFESLEKYAL
jgi:hypothetical protein